MSTSSRRRIITVMMVLVVMVALPSPTLAASVGSINTTESDFNAGTYGNYTVSGSGSSASLELDYIADANFEDDNLNSWTGDTGSYEIDTTFGLAGGTSIGSTTTNPVSITRSLASESYSSVSHGLRIGALGTDGEFEGDLYSGGTRAFGVDVQSDGSVVTNTGTDTGIDISGSTWYKFEYTNIDYSSNTYDLKVTQKDGTNIGTKTGLAFENSVGSLDAFELKSEGGINFDELYLGSGRAPDSGTYTGASHTLDKVSEGFVDLTLSNAEATVTWQYYDGSSWVTERTDTYTTSGNKTVSLSADATDWRVTIDTAKSSPDPVATIEDEGVSFDSTAPDVDDSSASPSGGEKLTQSDVTLSIDVADADFATTQNDAVDVAFEVQKPGESTWTTHETKTITSNGTVNSDFTAEEGGEWSWRVTATDDYGNSVTSGSFKFTSPSTLYLYNETDTSELVTTSTPVEVTFFGEDQTITQTTTNGKVNLTSQNVTVPFVVQVEETSDYHGRTIYIQDIYAQQRVYLLNKNESTVESKFVLDDPTGEFGPETLVYIKKPVNVSGSTEYQTIVADRFGVEGVSANLEQGQRYRISVRSQDGQVQEIGPYRAERSESVTIQPGAPSVQLSNRSSSWDTGATINNQTLEVQYVDDANLTTEVTLYVHERGNTSNKIDTNRTYQDPSDLSVTYSLTENQSQKEWVVNYEIDRDGETINAIEYASRTEDTTPSGLDGGWVQIFGVGAVILTAGLFSEADVRLGALATPAVAGVLWYAGWLEGVASLAAITMGLFVGVLVYVRGSARGY